MCHLPEHCCAPAKAKQNKLRIEVIHDEDGDVEEPALSQSSSRAPTLRFAPLDDDSLEDTLRTLIDEQSTEVHDLGERREQPEELGDEQPEEQPAEEEEKQNELGEVPEEKNSEEVEHGDDEECNEEQPCPIMKKPAAVMKRPAANAGASMEERTPKAAVTLDKWLCRVPVGGVAKPPSQSKLFQPEVETELNQFLLEHGYQVDKSEVICEGSGVATWGMAKMENGKIVLTALPKPCFGKAPSLKLILKPERPDPMRKRKLPKSGLIKKKFKLHRFGTLRRHGACHQRSTILGVRGCKDFANNLYFCTKYQKRMTELGRPRGKYVNPRMGEWVMGMARDWTALALEAQAPQAEQAEGRIPSASLFSGVGGIELGVGAALDTKIYVEHDSSAQAVLRKRMGDGHLSAGELHNRVEELDSAKLQGAQCLTAGFPCPDIAISGKKRGLSGERSSLFRFVVRAAVLSKCRMILLENVAHLISKEMMPVFFEILAYMHLIGFVHLRWGVVSAGDVGSPQLRKRWFLAGWKDDEMLLKTKALLPKYDPEALRNMAKEEWNPQNAVPIEEWMVEVLPQSERERLLQLGNAVVPRCAEVAFSLLTHMM